MPADTGTPVSAMVGVMTGARGEGLCPSGDTAEGGVTTWVVEGGMGAGELFKLIGLIGGGEVVPSDSPGNDEGGDEPWLDLYGCCASGLVVPGGVIGRPG